MPTDEKDSPHDDKLLSWRLIYEEAVVARNQKFSNLCMLNEKFNWVLVSDLVLFAGLIQIYSSGNSTVAFSALVVIAISITACIYGVQIKPYPSGPKQEQMIGELHKGKTHDIMLSEISQKIQKDISVIENSISSSNQQFKLSSSLLLLGTILTLLSLISCI